MRAPAGRAAYQQQHRRPHDGGQPPPLAANASGYVLTTSTEPASHHTTGTQRQLSRPQLALQVAQPRRRPCRHMMAVCCCTLIDTACTPSVTKRGSCELVASSSALRVRVRNALIYHTVIGLLCIIMRMPRRVCEGLAVMLQHGKQRGLTVAYVHSLCL